MQVLVSSLRCLAKIGVFLKRHVNRKGSSAGRKRRKGNSRDKDIEPRTFLRKSILFSMEVQKLNCDTERKESSDLSPGADHKQDAGDSFGDYETPHLKGVVGAVA